MALLRSSTLFINYLSESEAGILSFRYADSQLQRMLTLWLCTEADPRSAHDQALARSGKSITASDVLKAITEMDFGPADELLPLLEMELAGGSITLWSGLELTSSSP